METGLDPQIQSGTPPGSVPAADPFQQEERIAQLEQEVASLRARTPDANKATLLFFSGDQDKALAGLMIGTTAASMGMDVTMFFTFWAVNALKQKRSYSGKDIKEKMIDLMTPAGADHMGVSQLNMLGMGPMMLKMMMKDKNIVSADELLEIARDSGVHIIACSTTMQVMGFKQDELMDGIEVAGAASYMAEASRSGCTLFI